MFYTLYCCFWLFLHGVSEYVALFLYRGIAYQGACWITSVFISCSIRYRNFIKINFINFTTEWKLNWEIFNISGLPIGTFALWHLITVILLKLHTHTKVITTHKLMAFSSLQIKCHRLTRCIQKIAHQPCYNGIFIWEGQNTNIKIPYISWPR